MSEMSNIPFHDHADGSRHAGLTCGRCPMMTVYQSPSGRIHHHKSCSGAGPVTRIQKVRMTEAEFAEAAKCRCLMSGWRADVRRTPMAGLPAETETS